MSKLSEIDAWLEKSFPALVAEHQVPGAAVAVFANGEVIDHAAGLLNTGTGVQSTVDSLFQVGSITKVWTTTLAMQLVDEGKLDLDKPVRTYLPEFVLSDDAAASRITVRQLTCHTSGFEGDIFLDTGQGDDCVAKLVAELADVPQLFGPGEMFSYNNAGYCVLGRVIEVLRGKSYDECLRDHLCTPLGLTHAATGPYDAIRYRAAIGHVQATPEDAPQPAPAWALTRSNVPAGSHLAMRPRDLLTFARMHLNDGRADDGTQVLKPESVHAMRERQVELPCLGLLGGAWGLGWMIFDWPGGPVIGHDGGTIGQSAFLRVVPGSDVAVALLTNGGKPLHLYLDIFRKVLGDLAGVEVPSLPEPNAAESPADPSRYVGEYSSQVADIVVSQDDDGGLWLERTPKGIFADLAKPEKNRLLGYKGDTLVAENGTLGLHMPHAFVGDDGNGRALYVHTGRADRRVNR
ncbi:serine hydrolase domain-containing protein [Kibdelosporangium phytohabitans]|uniref:Serine hydrolase n=1 Tax=Kibdelosporangium phytohabitans TaxID=860235 RepID=A0A0N9I4Q0_9PSEU|nr:serine hydrolase domain-containing protein [Kibdelosporangium phytohabitans]ALG09825.1 serine hydrolase [Kibdelosporangium phytohabitans]MBE1468787.1 CubicO group peptidase (beta-lactamase class C family) [Kibdelosporangium phytohabitans]